MNVLNAIARPRVQTAHQPLTLDFQVVSNVTTMKSLLGIKQKAIAGRTCGVAIKKAFHEFRFIPRPHWQNQTRSKNTCSVLQKQNGTDWIGESVGGTVGGI